MSKEIKTQEPTKSNKKYIVLAIVVILAAIGIMSGNSNEDETATTTVATTEQEPVAEQAPVAEYVPVAEETPAEAEPTVARIDITTPLVNADEPQFKVYVDGSDEALEQTDWLAKHNSQGYSIIKKKDNNINLQIETLSNATIAITLRGPWDKGEDGNLIPHKVTYTSFQINNENILNTPKIVWFEEPFMYSLHVKDNESINISISWQ